MADLSPPTERVFQARLAKGRTSTSARCRIRSSRASSWRRRQLFLIFPGPLAFRSGSGISQALADLEAHRTNGRDVQAFPYPQVAAAAGAALIDLEATEADEVHRLALADGTFDPGERATSPWQVRSAAYSGHGSDEFGQFAPDVSQCAGLGAKYYEYFLFSWKPCATATVNVSDFFSSRRTPASQPANRADLIVWTFGGSTMQEFETTDERSTANAIAKTMAAAGVGARIENFGAPTFQSSLELVKFMTLAARVPADRLPGVVVFYDGYNDANPGYYFGAGNMQNDLSAKLAALVEHKSGTVSLYGVSMGLAAHSEFWKTHIHKRLEHALFHDPDPQPDQANLRRAVDIYLRNTQIAGGVCAAIGARCFFVLQPLIATKTPLGPGETQVIAAMKPSLLEFARSFYALTRAAMQATPHSSTPRRC
jgi:hypothetical protein